MIPEWVQPKSLANGISNGTAICDHNEANPLKLISGFPDQNQKCSTNSGRFIQTGWFSRYNYMSSAKIMMIIPVS